MSWIVIAALGGLVLIGGLFALIFWLLGKGGEE